jgi:hypothetical protein
MAQNASPPVPFFSKNYSKFRAIFVSFILPCRPRLWPSCHDAHSLEIVSSTYNRADVPRCWPYALIGGRTALEAEPLRFLKNIEEMRARTRQQSADGPDDLYFGDEVPDNSQAGDGIRSA